MATYEHERAKPIHPHCRRAAVSLRFTGHYLTLSGKKTHIFPAVSGRPDKSGSFAYTVERQKERASGPIPQGEYWIDFEELWTNAWWKRGSASAWGNYRITIHVFPGTKIYDRGGFFLHGGTVPGSAGCIDLSLRMDDFVAALREELGEEKHCYVSLSVYY